MGEKNISLEVTQMVLEEAEERRQASLNTLLSQVYNF